MDSAEASLLSKGFSAITLWVLEGNVRTRRFYEIAGYCPDQNEEQIVIDGVELNELRYRKLVQKPDAADGRPVPLIGTLCALGHSREIDVRF